MLRFNSEALDLLATKIANAAGAIEKKLGAGDTKEKLRQALSIVTEDAKARIHNITGTLSRSVQVRVTVSPDSRTLAEAGVRYKGTKMRYAHCVEGGHGGPHGPADPHPFWEPAVEVHGEEAAAVLEALAEELVDAVFE